MGDVLAVPRAVGQALGNTSPLLSSILNAPDMAYSYNPKESSDDGDETSDFATGAQMCLVSAVQARNSARITVLGSVEMLEDAWFDAKVQLPGDEKKAKTGNRVFAEKLSAWTFKELGVLKVGRLQHYLSGGEQAPAGFGKKETGVEAGGLNPKIYRIKNEAVRIHLPLSPLASKACSACGRGWRLTQQATDVHNNPLRILLHALDPLPPRPLRRLPARIHHALSLPPPHPAADQVQGPQRHHLHPDLPPPRPARHLQLPRQLQAPLLDQRGREAHRHRAALCPRRVAAELRDRGRLRVDHGHCGDGRGVVGVCGGVALERAVGGGRVGEEEEAVSLVGVVRFQWCGWTKKQRCCRPDVFVR